MALEGWILHVAKAVIAFGWLVLAFAFSVGAVCRVYLRLIDLEVIRDFHRRTKIHIRRRDR